MSTATGGFDVKRALETIDGALAYDQPLRRRTEGVIWMVSGLSSALVAATYAWVAFVAPPHALDTFWWPFFVMYAVLLGASLLTWRIAGVVHAKFDMEVKRAVVVVVLFGAALVIVAMLLDRALNPPDSASPAFVQIMTAIGTVGLWGVLGAIQWSRLSDSGRMVTWAVGVIMLVASVPLMLILHPSEENVVGSVIAATAIGGALPFLAGVWRVASA